MSEWGDRHEEESHDEGKVGSKRPRGSRGPEGKLAQKARTLRRRAERAEGHLHAEQPRYRLGGMTEQSFVEPRSLSMIRMEALVYIDRLYINHFCSVQSRCTLD